MKHKPVYYAFPLISGICSSIFVANISLLEILALIWFAMKGHKYLPSLFSQSYCMIGLAYISSIALLFSDIVNSTDLTTLLKGVGAYFLVPTMVLFLLRSYDIVQLWILFLSTSFALVLRAGTSDSNIFGQDSLKFGLGAPLLILAIVLIPFLLAKFRLFNATLVATGSTVLAVITSLWINLRLFSFVALIAYFAYIYARATPNNKNVNIKQYTHSLILTGIFLPIIILIISFALSFFATLVLDLNIISSDLFSEDAVMKTKVQLMGSYGLLLGGRSEIFASISAWLQKPILGWGSWAADPSGFYRTSGLKQMISLGYTVDYGKELGAIIYRLRSGGSIPIPTHSVLLNLLVWSGLSGFLPMYVFTIQYILNFVHYLRRNIQPSYSFLFIFSFSIWNIFFSPMGYTNRVGLQQCIALSICYLLSDSQPSFNQVFYRLEHSKKASNSLFFEESQQPYDDST